MSLGLLDLSVVEDVGVDVALESGQLGQDQSGEDRVGHHHAGGGGGGALGWPHHQAEDEAGEEGEDGLEK